MILTDGENTVGRDPWTVFEAIKQTHPNDPTQLHVIAYDVDKRRFEALERLGAKIYGANNTEELANALSTVADLILEAPIDAKSLDDAVNAK